MITGRPERLSTFDYRGLYRYFLTYCTFERRRLFVCPERVDLVRTQFLRASAGEHFAILAYCFMPDHVHLLVQGDTDDADCRSFIKRSKQYSGFHYRNTFGGRLWQRYGFERTLRSDEATLTVARYIFENPLRAGLAQAVEDYPFLGSDVYAVSQVLEAVRLNPRNAYRSG